MVTEEGVVERRTGMALRAVKSLRRGGIFVFSSSLSFSSCCKGNTRCGGGSFSVEIRTRAGHGTGFPG